MSLTRRILYLLAGSILLIVMVGCFQPYRMDVQQGNVITRDQIQRLQIGMSRREAQFVLGTPLVKDPFHANRWDYYFSLRQGENTQINQYLLSLFFESDSLVEIHPSGDNEPVPIAKSKAPKKNALRTGLFQRLWDWIRPND